MVTAYTVPSGTDTAGQVMPVVNVSVAAGTVS